MASVVVDFVRKPSEELLDQLLRIVEVIEIETSVKRLKSSIRSILSASLIDARILQSDRLTSKVPSASIESVLPGSSTLTFDQKRELLRLENDS